MQVELEDNRQHVRELAQAKKQLQAEVATIKDRFELEVLAKKEEAGMVSAECITNSSAQQTSLGARRRLEAQLQELTASSSTSSTVTTELREAAEMYKAKAESYLARLETTEVEKAKAMRVESHGRIIPLRIYGQQTNALSSARKAVEEAERAHAATAADLKASEEQLRKTEERLNQLQVKLDKGSRELGDFEHLRRRLLEEMEDERDQHQKDLNERDFTIDQTRKKYQGERFSSLLLVGIVYG